MSVVVHSASGRSPDSSPSTPASRSTNSASRPTRTVSPGSTAAGSAVPSHASPGIATPSSSRSSPADQVFCPNASSLNGRRCAASRPQRTPAPTASSRSRSRSSSSRPKRLRTGAAASRSSTCGGGEPRVGQLQQPGDDVEQRVDLAQRPVGQPHRQRLRRVRARPERGGDERRERLDVGAHDEDVARLERGVGLQQAEHDLAQHLDLAVRPVAGVHLHGACRRRDGDLGRTVVAQLALQPAEQRGRRVGARVVLVDEAGHGGREPHLQLAHVAPERGQQRVRGGVGARVGGARRHARPGRATLAQSAGEGCGSHRCTSRCSPSAARTASSCAASRVGPNSDSRSGSAATAGSARRAAHAASTRSAGSGPPIRARSRRHSSGCHARSASTSRTRPPASSAAARAGGWRRCRTARPAGGPGRAGGRGGRAATAHHGSSAAASSISSSGHTARSGCHGSSSGARRRPADRRRPPARRGSRRPRPRRCRRRRVRRAGARGAAPATARRPSRGRPPPRRRTDRPVGGRAPRPGRRRARRPAPPGARGRPRWSWRHGRGTHRQYRRWPC